MQRMRLSDFVFIVFTLTDEFSDPLVLTEADRGQRKEARRGSHPFTTNTTDC